MSGIKSVVTVFKDVISTSEPISGPLICFIAEEILIISSDVAPDSKVIALSFTAVSIAESFQRFKPLRDLAILNNSVTVAVGMSVNKLLFIEFIELFRLLSPMRFSY